MRYIDLKLLIVCLLVFWKVNQRSASLMKLGGHIMKLGLNCTRRDHKIIPKCLVFKSKGKLNCKYQVTATITPTKLPFKFDLKF